MTLKASLHHLCALIILLFWAHVNAFGQTGYPNILNFSPKSYSTDQFLTSPQNWGVVQDDLGRMYFGNTNGVLVFDGVHWQMVKGTEDLRFFKFAKDGSGRIYTGGLNEIGYLTADSSGKVVFKSMISLLPDSIRDFGRIFDAVSQDGLVFFRSTPYVICWDGEAFTYWNADEKLRMIFPSTAGLFVNQSSGLFLLKNGTLNKVFDNDAFNRMNFRAVLPVYVDHADRLLLVTEQSGLYMLTGNTFKHLPSVLDSTSVFSCSRTNTGDLAVGTDGKGLFIVSPEGKVKTIYNERSMLQQNQVVIPYEDSQGGLWTALFSGVSRVSYNDRISTIQKDQGLGAIGTSLLEVKDGLAIGSLGGLYLLVSDSDGLSEAKKVNEISGTVAALLSIDSDLLVFTDNGIYRRTEAGSVNKIHDLKQIISATLSKKNQNTVYLARHDRSIYNGRYENGHWKDEKYLTTLPHQTYSMVEDSDGSIWAAFDGISRISPDPESGNFVTTTFDSATGFVPEMGGYVEVTTIKGQVVFGTGHGIYEYDSESGKIVPSSLLGERFDNKPHMAYNLTETSNGNIWVTSNQHTGVLIDRDEGPLEFDSVPLITTGVSDVWKIYEDREHRIWASGTEALICYDPRVEQHYDHNFNTLIHQVNVGEDSVIFHGYYTDDSGYFIDKQPDSKIHELPFSLNDLVFYFAAPFFEAPDKLEYSYFLEGQDDHWSNWQHTDHSNYTNLDCGEYTFKVRARNAFGVIGSTAEYRFVILPPWYQTYWAFGGYLIFIALTSWGLISIATYRLRQSKVRLEQVVEERTSEIRENLEQLEKQKTEIESERRKSDKLLLNILPKETAEELKEQGFANTKRFEQVTVLFTDFKNFTQISEKLSPEQLVNELNECFSVFDEISERHGLEKIKTVGDSYMCAGGLPVPTADHAFNTVAAALEMQQFINQRNVEKAAKGEPHFEMRCGINTGPVVAGVVGMKKFQYDIWGDTVNLASRMESSGEIGKVNISQSTYELIKGRIECTFRGEVEAKHKGKVKMYFAERLI